MATSPVGGHGRRARNANALLFERKRVEGFTMYEWLESTSLIGQIRTASAAQAMLSGPLATAVRVEGRPRGLSPRRSTTTSAR